MIAFVGDGQAAALASLYRDLVGSVRGDHVSYYPSQGVLPPELVQGLLAFDRVCIQDSGLGDTPPVGQGLLATKVHRLPRLSSAAFWPFHDGAREVSVEAAGIRHFVDSFLQRQIADGVSPAEAVQAYLNVDVAALVRFADPTEAMFDHFRAVAENTGINLGPLLKEAFRHEQLFLAPATPSPRLLAALAAQLFAQLDASSGQCELALACRPVPTPPVYELPVHPALATQLGLNFLSAGTRYQIGPRSAATFAEYAAAYVAGEPCGAFPADAEGPASKVGRLILGLPSVPAPGTSAIPVALHKLLHRDGAAAAVELEAAARDCPADAEAQEMLADALGRIDDHAGARDAAERAVTLAPERGLAWLLLGRARRSLGELREAELAACEAVRVDPMSADARTLLAELREDRAERPGALQVLGDGLALGVWNAQTFSLLGHFHLRNNDLDRAEEAFMLGVDHDPDRGDLRRDLVAVRGLRRERKT